MTSNAQYWQMVTLTGAGKLRLRDRPMAKEFLQQVDTAALEDDRALQRRLWKLWKAADSDGSATAGLCLRCYISHNIAEACKQLAYQFGQVYSFVAADLLPLVLDDEGELTPRYQSLALEVLAKYDPSKAALNTWASRLTKSHAEINRFLLERGLYRISDWALLNDTAVGQLEQILSRLGTSERAWGTELLKAYHEICRRDRITQRLQIGTASRCKDPTPAQLSQMSALLNRTESDILSSLYELASSVRQYKISIRSGNLPTQTIDNLESSVPYVDSSANEDSAEDSFLEPYRRHFLTGLEESIKTVTHSYVSSYQRRKSAKGEIFLRGLALFHCEGLSMSAIAPQLGLKSQVQVTRLLQLKRFRTEICAHWFNHLNEWVKGEALKHISADQLSQVSTQMIEESLKENTEAVIQEAAAEAKISINRAPRSIFASHLCALLPDIEVT